VPVDPDVRAVLDVLNGSAGAAALSDGTAVEARERYRALAMARRGPDYVPIAVAGVEDSSVPRDGGGAIPVRIYRPLEDRGRVVTYLHGGGWVLGDLDTHDPLCRFVANGLGATVVSVQYRLSPEHPFPAPLDDAVTAARWVGATFGDRAHVVAGDSAGAGLTAGVALRVRELGGPSAGGSAAGGPSAGGSAAGGPRAGGSAACGPSAGGPGIAALLMFYPPTDPALSMPSIQTNGTGYFPTGPDMAWFIDQYLPNHADRRDPTVDLLHADLHGLPPAVVATAEFDPLRDEGDAFAARLASAGVTVRHLAEPSLIHGYAAFASVVPAARAATDRALAAVDSLLGGV
jgi:acetyl esterase